MTGAQLKTTLLRLRISQMGFARRLKIQPSTVRRWIAGRSPVPEVVALLLAEWLQRPRPRPTSPRHRQMRA